MCIIVRCICECEKLGENTQHLVCYPYIIAWQSKHWTSHFADSYLLRGANVVGSCNYRLYVQNTISYYCSITLQIPINGYTSVQREKLLKHEFSLVIFSYHLLMLSHQYVARHLEVFYWWSDRINLARSFHFVKCIVLIVFNSTVFPPSVWVPLQ